MKTLVVYLMHKETLRVRYTRFLLDGHPTPELRQKLLIDNPIRLYRGD